MTIADSYFPITPSSSSTKVRTSCQPSTQPSQYTKPFVTFSIPTPATYTGLYGSRIAPLPSVSPRCAPSKLDSNGWDGSSLEGASHIVMQVPSLLSRAQKTEPVRLKWDMAYPLAQSYDREARVYTLSSNAALYEPALSTTTEALIVLLVGSPYPYEILVKPSSDPSAPPYVTTLDVLSTVYANLDTVVEPREMHDARKLGDVWHTAWSTYMRRTGGKKPFKRINFLAERTVFFGMEYAELAGKLPKLELLVGCRPSS